MSLEVKDLLLMLNGVDDTNFMRIEGAGLNIEDHYHITEVALVNRTSVDCGGTPRDKSVVRLQVLVANDTDHRLSALKLKTLLSSCLEQLDCDTSLPLEFEIQSDSLSIYTTDGILARGKDIIVEVMPTQTECLAPEKCKIDDNTSKCCTGNNCG